MTKKNKQSAVAKCTVKRDDSKFPATLDLRENAVRSIKFLENIADPRIENLPYFYINFAVDPPEFVHAIYFEDLENIARSYYGIVCAQQVAGTRAGDDLRKAMIQAIERRLTGPYGFIYSTELTEKYSPGILTPGSNESYSWLWADRSVLQAWIMDASRMPPSPERSRLEGHIRTMVAGLDEFSVRQGKYVFFPTYTPSRSYVKPADFKLPEEREEIWEAMYSFEDGKGGNLPAPKDSLGGMIYPLVEWYEISKDPKALALAVGISNTIVDFHTATDNKTNPVGCMSNNHGTLYALTGVLAVSRHVRNRRHIAWARMLFEFYRSRCASSFGWVTENENIDQTHPLERPSCEGCATIDLVNAGIELAKAGFTECWDIVERVTRNYLTQSQAKHIPRISLKGVEINSFHRAGLDNVPAGLHDNRDVARRAVGFMAGWGAPNDIIDPRGRAAMCVQNCCGTHLPFGLYRVWEHIALMRAEGLFINLLLNHAGPWCQVIDYQPLAGKVEVVMKKSARLFVRMPDWVEKDKVRVFIGRCGIKTDWDQSRTYVSLGRVAKGATARIEYPLRRWSVKELLAGSVYTTEWVGDTVVSIDPPGRFIPIFNSIKRAQTRSAKE